MAQAHYSMPRTSSLDPELVANLTTMRDELYRRANAGQLLGRVPLPAILADLMGNDLPRTEQIRVLFFAAPLVRRIVLESIDPNASVEATEITFRDVQSWLWWLDAMDPLCARMIDLRYFAGLTVKETALLLQLPPAAVIRELRFARSWLRIRMPQGEVT
jgi:hypothetical protein